MEQQHIVRLKRAVTQKNIKLVFSNIYDTHLAYKVLGNTGSSYIVQIPYNGYITCECIDFKKHKSQSRCKHIHFIFIKIFKLLQTTNSLFISPETFKELCVKHNIFITPSCTTNAVIKARNANEDCCICFEPVVYPKQENVVEINNFICPSCNNGFHLECITEVRRYKNNCPLCRGSLTVNLPSDIVDESTSNIVQQILDL